MAELPMTADELLEQGDALMAAGVCTEAVDCFARCMELRAAHHGDFSIEAASVAVKYATALVEHATLTGNAGGAQKVNKDGAGPSTATVADDGADDVEDLQLAWEVAEVARVAFEREAEKQPGKFDRQVADAYHALGDIQAALHAHTECLPNYEKALQCLDKCDDPELRLQTEIYFKMSVSQECLDNFADAIAKVTKAISLINFLIQQQEEELQDFLLDVQAAPAESAQKQAEDAGPASKPDDAPTAQNDATEAAQAAATTDGVQAETAAVAGTGAEPSKADDSEADTKSASEARVNVVDGHEDEAPQREQGGDQEDAEEEDDEEEDDEEEESEDELTSRKSTLAELRTVLQSLEEHKARLVQVAKEEEIMKAKVSDMMGLRFPSSKSERDGEAPNAATGDEAPAKKQKVDEQPQSKISPAEPEADKKA